MSRQKMSPSTGSDGTSLLYSLSSQCGPAPYGTLSAQSLPPLKRLNIDFFLPIVEAQVFGWTDSTITLFTLWGTLDFPLFFFPSALLLRKSLRLSVVKKHQLSVVKNRPICARKICEMILFNVLCTVYCGGEVA